MMTSYNAKGGERLDEIVFKHYGNLDFFNKVLELNGGLNGKLHLEDGDKVLLPKIEQKEVETEENLKALW